MDLNNVTVELRPRGEWEAVDFGARLVRRDAAAIYRVWFAITLPILLLALLAVIYSPYPSLSMFAYWWLEPVADGPILRIISRRLFGENANVKSALRSLPHLLARNIIFLLPPYRFHLARSTAMPVTQLEGLRGADRRSRAKVLNIKIANHGMGVTLAYHHLVMALCIGAFLIVFALVPASYRDTLGMDWLDLSWAENNRLAIAINLLLFYVAQSALQPWFVGAGFGLYINCRTQLEAWDIEVAFRRLVQRRAAGLAGVTACLLVIAVANLMPDTARAEESESYDSGFAGYWDEDETSKALAAALGDEALKTTRETEVWRKIDRGDDAPETDSRAFDFFPDWFRLIPKFLAYLVEFSFWIIIAGLLILLVLTSSRWLPYVGFGLPQRPAKRRIFLSSGELTAKSLPDDLPLAVTQLLRDGRKRDALSLLYRGSVFAAVTRHGVQLPPSATEDLCLDAVRAQTDTARSGFFAQIVAAWVYCAYGFRLPHDETVLSLCADWNRHFGEAA